MPDRRSLYIGRSGELAVLSEFLSRGYNAATPEVDSGEDVFVIEDGKSGYWPVQVKTATAKERKDGTLTGEFKFRRDQLVSVPTVELTYILALRHNKKWSSFLIIPRYDLNNYYQLKKLGSQKSKTLTWTFTYNSNSVKCQQVNMTKFKSNWNKLWPDLFSKS